ncbi:polyketide synthase [Mycolicibacterium smegmatis]|uniref:polyketide synthase n=1 Tax=Mycolicibacterium smegmatis TaxID=1772 RepID=UPI0020A2B08B|nr:polyketide synthase [Mycolicibacterium smegmatis]MCP2623675.1 polyketide synthase [Mycolicibacterium smegmatis]MCP2627559.1 polyketide synthase [Mycolicibacterium smegmatis]
MATPLLAGGTMGARSWIADHDAAGPAGPADTSMMSTSLGGVLAAELDGARESLGCTTEEIVLAALGRAVARTMGEGLLAVDVDSAGSDSVDGGAQSAARRVVVPCVSRRELSGAELLATARATVSTAEAHPRADVSLRINTDGVATVGEYGLCVHVDHSGDSHLRIDWAYDTRNFDRYTVEELSEQFPLALIEVTSG